METKFDAKKVIKRLCYTVTVIFQPWFIVGMFPVINALGWHSSSRLYVWSVMSWWPHPRRSHIFMPFYVFFTTVEYLPKHFLGRNWKKKSYKSDRNILDINGLVHKKCSVIDKPACIYKTDRQVTVAVSEEYKAVAWWTDRCLPAKYENHSTT